MTSAPPNFEMVWTGRETGDATVVISWLVPPTEQAQMEMRQRVTNFCLLGRLGAFPLARLPPAASTLALLDEYALGMEETAYRLAFAGIDPRCFGVLRNLVWKVSGTQQTVRRLMVRDEAASINAMPELIEEPDFPTAADFYPPESESIDLDVEEQEESYDLSKSRRCLIEFADPVSEEVLKELNERLRSLFDVLADGGFSPPVRPADDADVWLETTQRFDEISFEFVFSVFDASDETWNVAINMLEQFSSTVQKIVRIELD